ncbi:MAG: transaldolase [Aliidongia sp.]
MIDKLKAAGLRIKLFMDGADAGAMREAYRTRSVSGFTTNPTLMRKAGITDYERFAREVIDGIPDLPVSFEVFSDDFPTMEREARKIASWGGDTYIKIPITNTKRESAIPLIQALSAEGFSLNVTAMMSLAQVEAVAEAVSPQARTIFSVFAGRVADTGVDPVPLMRKAAERIAGNPKAELLWASPRELLNLFHAEESGCHIITATSDIIKKLELVGKDLEDYSLETVQMFYRDAVAAGFSIV